MYGSMRLDSLFEHNTVFQALLMAQCACYKIRLLETVSGRFTLKAPEQLSCQCCNETLPGATSSYGLYCQQFPEGIARRCENSLQAGLERLGKRSQHWMSPCFGT
eukprot:TRINITY_DN85332_c0_g1_i1.p2 TRINITY_DN85332_c0_g1~~TRINITY_DN85332_c0_g1_i1.p2  ORF type:complete len:105 (+),score=14.09 TRINITY_DN85332_c0_g1_i1:23-337(+)